MAPLPQAPTPSGAKSPKSPKSPIPPRSPNPPHSLHTLDTPISPASPKSPRHQRPPLPRLPPFPPPTPRPLHPVLLTHVDIRPVPHCAADIRAGVWSIQAACDVFDRMLAVVDRQPRKLLDWQRMRNLERLVRELQKTGEKAAGSALALARCYHTFAARQARRLATAARIGWRRRRMLEKDGDLRALGQEMWHHSRELSKHIDVLVRKLKELATEVDAVYRLKDDIARWKAVMGFLSRLLKTLVVLSTVTSLVLQATPYGEVADLIDVAAGSLRLAVNVIERQKRDKLGGAEMTPEEIDRTSAILKKEFPSLLQSASKQLDQHTDGVKRLWARVDGIHGRCYVSRGHARRAEREWGAEARSLSPQHLDRKVTKGGHARQLAGYFGLRLLGNLRLRSWIYRTGGP